MTGKELIIYILSHNLENDEVIIDGKLVGFMDEDETAAMFGVGPATIKLWHDWGWIKGVTIGGKLYFPQNVKVEKN